MWSVGDAWLLKGVFLGLLSVAMVLSSGAEAGAADKPVRVKLTTGMGDIVLELYPDKAPATVANFLQYVKEGHYNGTVFHRVINGFMIQGGGLDADMREKPTRAPIQNEADNGLKNEPYTIAMARTSDPHSATSQFFINVANNQRLNHTAKTPSGWGYTVFGKVIEGQDVVDKIKALPTTTKGMYQNVPQTPVTITKATVISQ
jgi:peptidyl-prolyl cis-trans isomerase B (cyclophilin B)